MDPGADFHAAISSSDVPRMDGRRMWLGRMNNWSTAGISYLAGARRAEHPAHHGPANAGWPDPARAAAGGGLRRLRTREHHLGRTAIPEGTTRLSEHHIAGKALEIISELEPGTATEFGLKVRVGEGEETLIGVETRGRGRPSWTTPTPENPPDGGPGKMGSAIMPRSEILCVGEVLWDSLPAGLFIGGAPFNVACHLHSLGVPVAMISRVGADRLGEEALRRIRRHGLSTELIQLDPELPTGFVKVTLDVGGVPEYEIVGPVAWDAIELTEALRQRAAAARVIVFGSLAQRRTVSRRTIERLCEGDALKVFDVNLRPPHDDRGGVRASLERADLVKLNDQELRQMGDWFALSGSPREMTAALAERFGLRLVSITRGGEGAALWWEGRWSEHPGFEVEVRDTVGAGDAFLAALLAGFLAGKSDPEILEQANLMGAYVATQFGAVPAHRPEEIARILERTSAAGLCPAPDRLHQAQAEK